MNPRWSARGIVAGLVIALGRVRCWRYAPTLPGWPTDSQLSRIDQRPPGLNPGTLGDRLSGDGGECLS
jgi:hypothetical protein